MDVNTFEHAVWLMTKFRAYEIQGMLAIIHFREAKMYKIIIVLFVGFSHAEKDKEQVHAEKICPYDERRQNKFKKKTVYERHNIHRSPCIRMIKSSSRRWEGLVKDGRNETCIQSCDGEKGRAYHKETG
jgi:hypothetical protein